MMMDMMMGGSGMSGMGNDSMGMMMNRMDMMMEKVDMMMSGMNSGMAPAAYGQGMGYMPAQGYAGQMYGYMQAPFASGGAAAHGGSAAAHGAATGFLGAPGAFNTTSLLTGILNFAIAIFAILLVVGLVVGAFIFLKKMLLGDSGTVVAAKAAGTTCTHCGTGLSQAYVFCPVCGEKKAVSNPVTTGATATA